MPDLSVIIPIYNTPTEALTRCFDSLCSLGDIGWEALLIDDGSEEPVALHCRAYADAHPNFRYLRKENGGVSSARNLGIGQAEGRYILFVDADDVLLGQSIAEQLGDIEADVVILDAQLLENGTEHTLHALSAPAGAVSQQLLLEQLICHNDLNGPWAKLFSRALLEKHSLCFATDFVSGEDWLFVIEAVEHAQSFCYIPSACYRYFCDHATGTGRLAKFPDHVLHNTIARYKKKQQLLPLLPPQCRQASAAAAAALLTETLFNIASDLLLAKLLTQPRKKTIRDTVASLAVYAPQMPRKARLKACILLRFPFVLRLAAVARTAYLRAK